MDIEVGVRFVFLYIEVVLSLRGAYRVFNGVGEVFSEGVEEVDKFICIVLYFVVHEV